MKAYDKLYLGIFISWMIVIILSYCIDWTINNNGFTTIATWLMFILLGLVCGRELTLSEVRK